MPKRTFCSRVQAVSWGLRKSATAENFNNAFRRRERTVLETLRILTKGKKCQCREDLCTCIETREKTKVRVQALGVMICKEHASLRKGKNEKRTAGQGTVFI